MLRICLCSDVDITPFLHLWGDNDSRQQSNPTWVANLIAGLRQTPGLELHVVALSPHISSDKDILVEGVQYHLLHSTWRTRWRVGTLYYFDVRRLVSKIKQIRPDLIHAHFNGEYHLADLRSGYPFVPTVHALLWWHMEYQGKSVVLGVMENIQKYTIRRSPFVICVSAYVERELQERLSFSGQAYVLPNAMDLDYLDLDVCAGLAPDEHRLLCIGDISPRKNVSLVVEALPTILRHIPNCHLRLAGPISKSVGQKYLSSLRSRVDALGLWDHVHFLGYCGKEQLKDELSRADILVHPAREETFGMAVVEAMAASKPVIATPVGAIPDLLEEGKSGFLIPPDNASLLAERIILLLPDTERRRQFGERGREVVVRTLHPMVVADRHVGVYKEVIQAWDGRVRHNG